MAINFEEDVNDNINNLKRWRERYSKDEYPFKVVLNMFYDLMPLKLLWDELNNSYGVVKFDNINDSFDFVHDSFTEIQHELKPILMNLLKHNVVVGGLNSSTFDELILKAKAKSNEAVEEIEFSYIVRLEIKATFLIWFSLGLTGVKKGEAYCKVFNVAYPISDWNSFDTVFQCFAEASVSEIAGLSSPDGRILTDSLYKPLPKLWH